MSIKLQLETEKLLQILPGRWGCIISPTLAWWQKKKHALLCLWYVVNVVKSLQPDTYSHLTYKLFCINFLYSITQIRVHNCMCSHFFKRTWLAKKCPLIFTKTSSFSSGVWSRGTMTSALVRFWSSFTWKKKRGLWISTPVSLREVTRVSNHGKMKHSIRTHSVLSNTCSCPFILCVHFV